jgi:Flp pilus assembly pilin Flp
MGVMISRKIFRLRRLLRDVRGVTALEYTLITVVIGTVVVAGVSTLGTAMSSAFGSISTALSVQVSGI